MKIDDVLALAAVGFRMHPLQERNKIPLIKQWEQKATTNETVLRTWYGSFENCNWGIQTGKVSGVVVVDIDPKHDGDATWKNLCKEHGECQTVCSRTGSGGTHYYYQYPKGVDLIHNRSNKLGKGIDIRADNGQVVAPGSIHPNGTQYTWIIKPEKGAFAPLPDWILKVLGDESGAEDFTPIGGQISKGNRNNSIYHQVYTLARAGSDENWIRQQVAAWIANQKEPVGDSQAEIDKTIDSALAAAKEKPLDLNDPSDVLAAELLLKTYGCDLIYVPGMGWFHWNEKVWQPDPDSAIVTQLFIKTMKALKDSAGGDIALADTKAKAKEASKIIAWAIQSQSARAISNAISIASTFPSVRKTADEIDSVDTNWLLNCNNGTIDLRTGQLLPHCKEDLITKMVGIDYDPEAKAPFWQSTLELICQGNVELIDYMKKALGYSITGSTDERCFFICWGETGANGKSTIMETVQNILGKGYAQMSDMVVITSSTVDNRVAGSLARLQGARFVSMNEAEEHQKLSEALIKQLTGGDTVQAKFLYKNPFEYVPVFKLWVRTNEKPIIRSQNNAIWDRVKLIPFEHSIPKDKRIPRSEIDEVLKAEYPGILAWLVAGAMAWKNDKHLIDPKMVTDAGKEYRLDNDIIRTFADDCIEADPKSRTKTTDLYRAFDGWCRDAGERYIAPRTKFTSRILTVLGAEIVRSNGQGYVQGFRLTNQASFYVV